MSARRSAFSILLLSSDPDLQAQLKRDLRDVTVTVAREFAALKRADAKRVYDGVIVETKRGTADQLARVQRAIDPARTLIVAGSRAALRHAPVVMQALANGHVRRLPRPDQEFGLEAFVEKKLGGFVRAMKHGSARDLHPMLVKAVERPLISLVLKETNGNQIQAAQFLGMNRNTLRKKIAELHIPVKRGKTRVG